jgi:NAD(P)-dependent dehydrogenase (short-subunit alcohol dehydrogenase family)
MQECIEAMRSKYPDVDYRPLQVNLSSQASVRAAAAEVLSWSDVPTLDIMVNSAGIMQLPVRTLTDEGIEMQLATNHVGHFLLVCLLMPKLIAAAEANPAKGSVRVVNVTSGSPTVARMRWSDLAFEKTNRDLPAAEQPPYDVHRMWGTVDPEGKSYIPLEGYNQSKVANVLFGIALNRRLFEKHGIVATAVHPGVIRTELSRDTPQETKDAIAKMARDGVFTYKSLGAGASTSLVAALDPKLAALGRGEAKDGTENYGAFLMDCQISTRAQPLAVSSAEAERLWGVTEKMVGEEFAW